MTNLWCALGGLVLGASGVWWLHRGQIQYLRDELTTAQDRLYAAWQDKAIIPPREAVQPPDIAPEVALPEWAYAAILDFDSVSGKQRAEAYIRQGIVQGKTKTDILNGLVS